MLSKQQFLTKHRVKFAGLSAAQKEARWKSYKGSDLNPPRERKAKCPSRQTPDQVCLQEYVRCVVDPFDSKPVCLPLTPGMPSFKCKVFTRGTMNIGTAGVGFVCGRRVFSNDVYPLVYHSTGAYAGTTFTNTGTGCQLAYSNSPFAAATIGTNALSLQVRSVGFGLRIRYTGTELDRGGTIIGLTEPDHNSILTLGESNVLAYNSSFRSPVDRKWKTVYHIPIDDGETRYVTTAYSGDVCYGFLVISTAGNSFDFEAYHIFEAIGTPAPSKSPSYVSPWTDSALAFANDISEDILAKYRSGDVDVMSFVRRILSNLPAVATSFAALSVARQNLPRLEL